MGEFIGNPNDFIAMTKRALQSELAKIVVDGIQYERIAGSVYELRELQKDGEEEKERFLDQMYKVQHTQKTDFDYVAFDSDVERQFAELLDSREDIKLFMKLPAKFKIDTPVGPYNPDWAIIKQEDGKIKSAKRHFEAIGVEDYALAVPERWGLDDTEMEP